MLELTGRLPDAVAAAVGGGSNAIGIFHAFIGDEGVALHGYEAGGRGVESGEHALTLTEGSIGVLHGSRTYVLQDDEGQTIESHSISAGLDYPGVGPEHAWLKDTGRASYHGITDAEAMEAFSLLARTEGIIPAIESLARPGRRDQARPRARPRGDHPGQPLRPRRQGHGHRHEVLQPVTADSASCKRGQPDMTTTADGLRRGARPTSAPPSSDTSRPASPPRTAPIAAATAMVEAGCDVIEIGLPYSDPLMDGPTIQDAVHRALVNGTRIADVMRTVEGVAKSGAAVLVMTYWNPIDRYGAERFARDLANAGGVGTITPDLTPEEAGPWREHSAAAGIDTVFLVAPSSPDARIQAVAECCTGFVYAASLMGVTGARASVSAAAEGLVKRSRAAHRPAGVRGPRRRHRRPGRRGRRLRRRCHRGLGVHPPHPGRPRRGHRPRRGARALRGAGGGRPRLTWAP